MNLLFASSVPRESGRVSQIDIPLSQYLSESFDMGQYASMFAAVSRLTELDLEREGNIIHPDEANRRFGLGGQLKFDRSVYESEARMMMERKEAELRRNFYLASGNSDGLFSVRGALGLGASAVGNMLNPLDLAFNFIPVVGSTTAATRAAALGRGVFRQTLEGGLVSVEALGRLPAPRLVTSLVNSGVGNLAAEIPYLVSAIESKEDYDVGDSVTNILAGTVLGTAIHLGLTEAVRVMDKLTTDTRETMLKEAVNQFVKGQDTDVTKYVDLDENIIRERVKFDEQAAFDRALQRVDLERVKKAVYDKYKETPVKAAFRFTDGTVRFADAHYQIKTDDLNPEQFKGLVEGFLTDKGTFVTREEASILVGITYEYGALVSEQVNRSSDPVLLLPLDREIFDAVREAGATEAEAMGEVRRIQRERADAEFFSRPEIQERVAAEKLRRVKSLVTRERNKYDEAGRFEKERDAEIKRQVAEGKILSEEQLKKWNFSKKTHEEMTTEIETQVKDLVEELREDLTEVNETREISETTIKNEHAAIDQALDCLLRNPLT